MKLEQQVLWISIIFQTLLMCMAAAGNRADLLAVLVSLCAVNVIGFFLSRLARKRTSKLASVLFLLTMLLGPCLALLLRMI